LKKSRLSRSQSVLNCEPVASHKTSMKHGYLALIVLCACTMEMVNSETMSEKTRRSPLEDFLSQIRGEGLLNSRMRFGKRIPAAQRPWNLDNYYAGLYLHPRIYQSYSDSFT
ncbi:hypothetical protein T4D_6624, partial [Trichinella pseudospiralis]